MHIAQTHTIAISYFQAPSLSTVVKLTTEVNVYSIMSGPPTLASKPFNHQRVSSRNNDDGHDDVNKASSMAT